MDHDLVQVYIQCDATECLNEQRVTVEDWLPPGWSKRGKRTYCPEHSTRRVR